jgi:PsbP
VMATVLSEHGGTATAAQTTPSHATGTIPAVTTSSPALIVALNDTGGTAPADFAASMFTPTQTGTTDGFTMSYPGSWQVKQHSGSPQRVYFDAQDAVSNVEVDLTPHTKSNMVTEAQYIKGQTLAQGSFPSYKQIRLSAENVRGTPGAIWEFYYTNSAGTMMKAEDILFILHTSNGPQSYAIFAASPNSVWQSTMLPRVEDMLKTFQPNP